MKNVALLLLLVPACAADAGPGAGTDQEAAGTTTYVSAVDLPTIDQGAWYDAIHKLDDELTAACPGTFCVDHPRLTPLTFSCSVSSKAGVIHDCAWTFAASDAAVDSRTAAVSIDAPTYQCHVHPSTTASRLLAILSSSPDAIHAPLPGMGSLVDALGATPIDASYVAPPTYVLADDYYTTAANQQKWQAAVGALKTAFDNICGDTFCGSDYGDLQAMQLACAITKSTGNVKSCTWIFGGSYAVVQAKGGALDETSQTFRCTLPVHGTIAQLVATWSGSGTEDAIHRPLPGATTSAYDALGGCLP